MGISHTSKEELINRLQEAARLVEIGGKYIHYKNPASHYIVEKLVILEADDSIAVSYSPADAPELTIIRPLTEWLDTVDGRPRFMKT